MASELNYNDSGNQGCRIGNWVEEKVLEDLTGVARYNRDNPQGTDTFSRLILHDTRVEAKQYESATNASFKSPKEKNLQQGPKIGPREAMRRAKYAQLARDEVEKELAEEERRLGERQELKTEASAKFQGQSDEGDQGVPPTRIARGRTVRPYARVDEEEVTDAPITFYSQRAIEGNIQCSSSTGSQNMFNRNTLFSNPVDLCSEKPNFEDTIANAYGNTLDTATCNMSRGLGTDVTMKTLRHTLVKDMNSQEGFSESALSSFTKTPSNVASSDLWEFFSSFTLPLSPRLLRSVVQYLQGWSVQDIIHWLTEDQTEGEGEGEEKEGGKIWGYSVTYTLPTLEVGECIVELNHSQWSEETLSLPRDEHIFRALLRRQKRVVPKSVNEVHKGEWIK